MKAGYISSLCLLLVLLVDCQNRSDTVDMASNIVKTQAYQDEENNTITSPCCWTLTDNYSEFRDCLNSKFNGIKHDSTFKDTLYYKNNRIVIHSIERDSCFSLMFNSGSISYFGACRTDFEECHDTMSSRVNDSLIILKRTDYSYDSLYNSAANWYSYAGYISDLNYHVLRSSGYESCAFYIMKTPETIVNTPYNHGFSINNEHSYYIEYMQNAYDLGSFSIYYLEDDKIRKIMSYYQDPTQDYYWDFKVVYWISDNKLAAIIGKDNRPGEYYYCVIVEINGQNSN